MQREISIYQPIHFALQSLDVFFFSIRMNCTSFTHYSILNVNNHNPQNYNHPCISAFAKQDNNGANKCHSSTLRYTFPVMISRRHSLLPTLNHGDGHAVHNAAVGLAPRRVFGGRSSSCSKAWLLRSWQRGNVSAGQHHQHLGHQGTVVGVLLHTQKPYFEAFMHFI